MSELDEQINQRQSELPLEFVDTLLVIGVGGIGSWVALNAALSGRVKRMILIDPDVIEESNLNRTPFRLEDIGNYKVDALKYLILERRACDVVIFRERTTPELKQKIKDDALKRDYNNGNRPVWTNCVIVDCRDDVFSDFYDIPCKYYKIGYDGTEVTIDGDPRNTPVWGRANGYRTVPSFVCPAQLAANLIVSDILLIKRANFDRYKSYSQETKPFDSRGRLNDCFTYNTLLILEDLFNVVKSEEIE